MAVQPGPIVGGPEWRLHRPEGQGPNSGTDRPEGWRYLASAPPPPDERCVDEGRPDRDDGGYHTRPSPRPEPAPMTSSHPLPAPCQWFSWLPRAPHPPPPPPPG